MTETEAIMVIYHNWPSIALGQHEELVEALKLGCRALARNTPRSPIERRMFDCETVEVGYCPICTEGVNSEMNYCSNCGGKLDWSEKGDDVNG